MRITLSFVWAAGLFAYTLCAIPSHAAPADRSRLPSAVRTAQVTALDTLAGHSPMVREIVGAMPNAEAIALLVSAESQPPRDAERSYAQALTLLTTDAEQRAHWGVLLLQANSLGSQGQPDAANELTRKAHEQAVRDYRNESAAVFYTTLAMAWMYATQDQVTQAWPLAFKVEVWLERRPRLAPQPADLVFERAELGRLWVRLDEMERGARLLRAVLAEPLFAKLSPRLQARVRGSLGKVAAERGQQVEAIGLFRAALQDWSQEQNPSLAEQEEIAAVRVNLGDMFTAQDQPQSAEPQYAAAASGYRAVNQPIKLAESLLFLGIALVEQKKFEPARAALAEAHTIYGTDPERATRRAFAAIYYAQVLIELKDLATAQTVLSEAAQHYESSANITNAVIATDLLGQVQSNAGQLCDAQRTFLHARALLGRLTAAQREHEPDLTQRVIHNSNVPLCAQQHAQPRN